MSEFWLPARARRPSSPFFTAAELNDVRTFYAGLSDAKPTPLRRFPGIAAKLGIGELLIKDESARFGLPAFKIVGARYAIGQLVARKGGRIRHLACATAGNHGRAVARAAANLGLEAHVYVPFGTNPARIAALRSEGAHVVITSVGYDEAVRLMTEEAAAKGWTIVSDTAWEGYEEVPRQIMAGYTRVMDEAASEWGAAPPDVVIVQVGVGSLAGAVAGWLEATFGTERPLLVTVEPSGSACLLESLRGGHLASLPSCAPTEMVGLRCAEVSPVAWTALEPVVDAAMAIDDELAAEAMDWLAHPAGADPQVQAGASGAAGVAALIALSREPERSELRHALKLSPASRVFAIATEGPTQLSGA
jgi:diaminopropionate ammonia-lyase